MTPKEKAQDLYFKFYSEILSLRAEPAKQCALIAVDEILSIGWNLPHYENIDGKTYWQEVKKEIDEL